MVLSADGTFRENWGKTFQADTYRGPRSGFITPRVGSYLYHKLSEATGELTLIPEGGLPRETIVLKFDTDLTADAVFPPQWVGVGDRFTFTPISDQVSPLINISTRVRVHSGEVTVVGFIAAKLSDFVIRIAGPALSSFQVQDVWNKPQFKIFAGQNEVKAWSEVNIDGKFVYPPTPRWDADKAYRATNIQAFQRVGAFPFDDNSNDVAVVVGLEAGPHTIVVQPSPDDPGGTALIEVYELR